MSSVSEEIEQMAWPEVIDAPVEGRRVGIYARLLDRQGELTLERRALAKENERLTCCVRFWRAVAVLSWLLLAAAGWALAVE